MAKASKKSLGMQDAEPTTNAERYEWEGAHDRIAELRDQVANWQPETLEGLIFKARYASDHFPEEYDDVIAHSIVDDLLAIAETGLRTVGGADV